jgi:hypothetical protein
MVTEGAPVCDAAKVVEFRPKSAKLSPEAKATLNEIAASSKNVDGTSVRLRAGVGKVGKTRTSGRVAELRTASVRGYLAERGVDPARITTSGVGEATTELTTEMLKSVEVVRCVITPPVAEVTPPTPPPPTPPIAVDVTVPPPPPAAPPPPPPVEPTPMPPQEKKPLSQVGVGAMLGGGVIGFVDEQARAFTDPGGSWEARMSVGTRSPLALEAAYVGTAQNINTLGIASDSVLISNGAEANVRLNFTRQAIQPYLFGGVGWSHYQLTNEVTNTSSLRDNDDIVTVPFGVGISFRLAQGLLLDIRGTGRATWDDSLMDGPYANTDEDAKLHTWNAVGRIGWEF